MSNKKDSLGDRMKSNYEDISRYYLTRRTPVIIRVDGKAFHTFTKGMKKPFDDVLVKSMQATMKYLCENIQGCVLGYAQSDEITLVLCDYKNLDTDAWFGYNVQKMCSVAASMATMAFNKAFDREVVKFYLNNIDEDNNWLSQEAHIRYATYDNARDNGAMFDARCFNIPKEEVTNCLIWRQQDATRNSIEAVGQANFSHKELHKKTCNDIQDMLMLQKGINWNDFATTLKRGSCCVKMNDVDLKYDEVGCICGGAIRSKWVIDNEIPIFTQDRDYIESRINFD